MKVKLLVVALCLCSTSFAEYSIRIDIRDKFNITKEPSIPEVPDAPEEWAAAAPLYGEYTEQRASYDCNGWAPNPNTVLTSSTFQQNSSNCKVDQQRTVQAQEKNKSGVVRPVGSPTIESHTLTNQTASRSYTVALSNWESDAGTCGSWSPNPLSLPASPTNVAEQTQTCNENKTRTRNESYVDNETSQTVSLPAKDETDSTPTTKSRDVNESFACQADVTGDDWNAYLVFKDGSGEYALMEDNSFANKSNGTYQFKTGIEYKESDSDTEVNIFYKGSFVETRNYYSQVVDVYQACTRKFQWDE
jgi:hypothetical protein